MADVYVFFGSINDIVGGLTRLTDSGLSITKWELFSGTLPPLSDVKWLDYFEEYKKRKYKYIIISTGVTALTAGAVTLYVLSNLSLGDDWELPRFPP